MLFWAKVCQWPEVIINACRVFQGKIPLIPTKLKRLTSTSRKTQGEYKEPTSKRVSFIGKGNERCQRVTWWTTRRKVDRKDETYQLRLIRLIMRRFGYYSKDTSKFRNKRSIYSETGGHVTLFFGKIGQKDKVKQPMESRVRSDDWRKNRAVNEIRRWSGGFSPKSGPTGQGNRPMEDQRIGW
jgi:hypothetical protein